jgi:hypothetical protein
MFPDDGHDRHQWFWQNIILRHKRDEQSHGANSNISLTTISNKFIYCPFLAGDGSQQHRLRHGIRG